TTVGTKRQSDNAKILGPVNGHPLWVPNHHAWAGTRRRPYLSIKIIYIIFATVRILVLFAKGSKLFVYYK
ncbi:MAG: hypothetical protein MJZ22_06200, partial [Candidatus Saccharibacteria bacterium]|nr:hypothetical protein [Candidatus Saccharibacteria bacterium]